MPPCVVFSVLCSEAGPLRKAYNVFLCYCARNSARCNLLVLGMGHQFIVFYTESVDRVIAIETSERNTGIVR